jgi:hypothetical protein
MGETEAMQKAADEARKVARSARAFGKFLDDYAKLLTQRDWRERADEFHRSALNKLSAINDGFATCNEWIAEGGKSAAAQAAGQATVAREAGEARPPISLSKPASFRIKRRDNRP